jgi:hypothetical protein
MFSRKNIGEAAKEIADHLHLVENVKALQMAQKELANSIRLLSERVRDVEADMRILKSETKFEALRETQAIVNSVQGGLNERIEGVAVKVALMENQLTAKTIKGSASHIAIGPPDSGTTPDGPPQSG